MYKRFLIILLAGLISILNINFVMAEGILALKAFNATTSVITIDLSGVTSTFSINESSLTGRIALFKLNNVIEIEEISDFTAVKAGGTYAEGNTIVITPTGGLDTQAKYEVVLKAGIADNAPTPARLEQDINTGWFYVTVLYSDNFNVTRDGNNAPIYPHYIHSTGAMASNNWNMGYNMGGTPAVGFNGIYDGNYTPAANTKMTFRNNDRYSSLNTTGLPASNYVSDYTVEYTYGLAKASVSDHRLRMRTIVTTDNVATYSNGYGFGFKKQYSYIDKTGTAFVQNKNVDISTKAYTFKSTNVAVRASIIGNYLQYFVDNDKLFDLTDSAITAAGTIGFNDGCTWNVAPLPTVDNLVITKCNLVTKQLPQIINLNVATNYNNGELTLNYDFPPTWNDASRYFVYTSNSGDSGFVSTLSGIVQNSGQIKLDIDDSYLNKYIRVAIFPYASNGDYNDVVYSSVIKGPFKPVISSLVMEGEVTLGGKLTAKPVFYDENNDAEGATQYQWYASDTFDGAYSPINGANTVEITIDSTLINKFIRLHIIPVSINTPTTGEEYISTYHCRLFEPIATNVAITGELKMGATLVGVYQYVDYNFQEEAQSTFRWLRSNEENGTYTEIVGQTTNEHTIINDDIDQYIKFEVTPKKALSTGIPVLSKAFLCPCRPIATDVSISGTAKENSILVGSYTYYHPNGFQEGASQYRWYIDNTVVSEAISYTVTGSSIARNIVFEVTPIAVKEPFSGDNRKSASISIGASSSNTYSKSGGGGGGTSVSTKVTQVIADALKIAKEETNFTDIENSPYKSDIIKMYNSQIIKGVSETLFDPEREVTRAEFATLMIRALKLETMEYDGQFMDVKSEDWYAENIQAAAKIGIINGYDGAFRPNDRIKKQEILKIIVQAYINLKGDIQPKSDLSAIKDADKVSDWAVEYIKKALDLKMISENIDINPQSNAIRGEVASILSKSLDQLK